MYKPYKWIDDESELSAEHFNHMEKGIANSQNIELIALSEQAPGECQKDNKYYNTIDKLIYTAIEDNTWSEEGETPLQGVFYLLLNEQSSYYFDGTTMISVGGGKGNADLYIQEEKPEGDGNCIWINPEEPLNNIGTEVTNSLDGNEENMSPSVKAVNEKINGRILYEGEGTNGAVSLNDDIGNYKYFEIYGYENMSNRLNKVFKFELRSGMPYIILDGNITQKEANGYITWSKGYDLSGNQISPAQYASFFGFYYNLLSSERSALAPGYDFFIYKVVGYK